MLETNVEKLYFLFRANYYKRMVKMIGTRKGSLSATESYCVEIIHLLGRPTVSEFAKYLGISVPNANYKINCLVEKNYVVRQPSQTDKRESHLVVTDKFLRYYGLKDEGLAHAMQAIYNNFTPEEISNLDHAIARIVDLMQQEESV